jgi:hypothetical protein
MTIVMTIMGYLLTGLLIGVWLFAIVHAARSHRYGWVVVLVVVGLGLISWIYLHIHVHSPPVSKTASDRIPPPPPNSIPPRQPNSVGSTDPAP